MKKRLTVLASAFISLLILSAPVTAQLPSLGLWASDFEPISKEGFSAFGGDPNNGYSWSMTDFKSKIYVGTNRYHLWCILTAFTAAYDLEGALTTGAYPIIDMNLTSPTFGQPVNISSLGWAQEMRGQIWRFDGVGWELVYRSAIRYMPELVIPVEELGFIAFMLPPGTDNITFPAGWYPISYGYRTLGTFNGYIYACGVGTWWPIMPFSQVIRSSDGEVWEDVTNELGFMGYNANNARGLVEFDGRLYVSGSLQAAPGSPTLGGVANVFYSIDGEHWIRCSDDGLGNIFNAEIYDLEVYNDHLYASTVNYATGYEVWKTNSTLNATGYHTWENVVQWGAGDTYNQYGMTMEVFKDYLYVGSSVGIGYVFRPDVPFGTSKALEVIRIDTEDNWELIVGNTEPSDPFPPGPGAIDPTTRTPLSMWPSGFGQLTNVYTWDMEVHDGHLYLGTLDLSIQTLMYDFSGLMGLADLFSEETINQLISELTTLLSAIDWAAIVESPEILLTYLEAMLAIVENVITVEDLMLIIELLLAGGDIWKTCDGTMWLPVTVNGFNNPFNYGIRKLHSVSDMHGTGLYVGTANPFGYVLAMMGGQIPLDIPLIEMDISGGCEVWYGFCGEPRFFVVPEVPVGPLFAVLGLMGGLGVYTGAKRKIRRPTTKPNT